MTLAVLRTNQIALPGAKANQAADEHAANVDCVRVGEIVVDTLGDLCPAE